MTTSSIKRRRSPHDAPASNDGDDDDGLANNDIERENMSSGGGSRSSSTSNDSVLASDIVSDRAAAESIKSISIGSNNLGKRDSEEDSWASKGYTYINPFVHRIEIDSHIEVAKVSFLIYSLYSLPLVLFPVSVSVRFIHAK